ncbi:hypothetical protein J4Q44_G00249780, partial [Coregonus suidteri]
LPQLRTCLKCQRSSKTTTPSITAVLVGRGSVTPARPSHARPREKLGLAPVRVCDACYEAEG